MKFVLFIYVLICSSVSFGQMNLQGSAQGTCDCYTITDNTNQNGAIWSPNTIDLSNPFDFTFEVNLGCTDNFGADGIVFVLQSNTNGLGNLGNGMGYSNPGTISPNSIGVEIDTWDSNPAVPTDIPSDHVGMNSGGLNSHNVVAPIPIPNIEDCLPHQFQVTWDPVLQNFEVLIDGGSIFIYNGDMTTNFFGGNPNVTFGWTGGTGGAMNVQTVCMYRNAAFTPDQTTVCANQVITFTDNSTSDLNMITNWAWAFGDGGTSALQNPTHSYGAPGNYVAQLTITDISGCTDVVTTNITVNPGLTLNMTQQDVSCFGANDGQITATPANGTGPYVYLWDDGSAQTTQTATGLSPNSYNVNVTDVNGCAGTGGATITEPAVLQFNSVNIVDASCGANNGSITINESGGTAGYQYSIDGGVTQQGANVFNGLAPNNYTLEIEDANGCTVTQNAVLNSNSAMVIDNLTATDETCGQSDGTITVNVSLGLAPYTYSLDAGVTTQPGNVFNGLPGGNYTVQIEDANNCIITGNVVVNSPTTLSVNGVNVTDPSCAGAADGQFIVTPNGGTGPYTYSNDNGVTFQGSDTFTGLLAGNYDIVLQDVTGCQANAATVLTDPPAVLIDNVVITDALCNGAADGTITITASGGAGGYTYSSDGGATFQPGNVITGLSAGNYTIQVNDMNGCFATSLEVVGEPTPVQIDNIIITDVTCNGLSDGAVEIFASQGTGPYTYSDDNVIFQAGPIINGLSAGNITVYVNDANGCQATGNAVISQSQPLIVALSNDTTICDGGMANLCTVLQGGTAPYSFTWNGVASGNLPCLPTNVAGNYTVEVSDANGCTSVIDDQNVFVNPPLQLNAGSDATVCAGDPANLFAEALGGNGGPYTFTWTNDQDATVLNGNTQVVNPIQTTVYTVNVDDGCSTPPLSVQVTISTFVVPTIDFSAAISSGCAPLDVTFDNNTNQAVLASTFIDYGNGNSETTSVQFTNQVYDVPGCYDLFIEITTTDGCIADITLPSYICVYQVPDASFTYSPNEISLLDPEVDFINTSLNADAYTWTFGDGSVSAETNPIHVFPETAGGEYPVTLTAITNEGCTSVYTQNIVVSELVQFYVPNTFTPNADSFNPKFEPVFIPGFEPLDYKFQIFNRWGEFLFESQDISIGWDGSFGGNIVADETFIWRMEFRETQTDKVYEFFGHVTVLK